MTDAAKLADEIEGLHAMEGGVLRRKRRKSRRPCFATESAVEVRSQLASTAKRLAAGHATSFVAGAILVASGFWYFRRLERTFSASCGPPGVQRLPAAGIPAYRGGSENPSRGQPSA